MHACVCVCVYIDVYCIYIEKERERWCIVSVSSFTPHLSNVFLIFLPNSRFWSYFFKSVVDVCLCRQLSVTSYLKQLTISRRVREIIMHAVKVQSNVREREREKPTRCWQMCQRASRNNKCHWLSAFLWSAKISLVNRHRTTSRW